MMSSVQVNDGEGQSLGRVRVGDTKQEALERLSLVGGLFDKDDVGLLNDDQVTAEGGPYTFKVQQRRGVLPRIQGGVLYRINDERIRCEFTLKNHLSSSQCLLMPTELMVDSGAQSELKLPGRKIVQLGLRRVGRPSRVRGSSTNHESEVLNFAPILVSATFDRGGSSETVEAYLSVRSDKNEYEEALAHANRREQTDNIQQRPRLETSEEPPRQRRRTESTASPSSAPPRITEIRLSPVRHRPRDKPDEQAVIGMEGLKKLRLHINGELQQLEIEEEDLLDPEW